MVHYQQATDYALAKNLPDWAISQRETAYDQLSEAAWPVFERFDYADFPLEEVTLTTMPISEWPDEEIIVGKDFPAEIVHVGNDEVGQTLDAQLARQGVILMDLFEAMQQHPDLVQKYMHQATQSDDKMTQQLFSHMTSGVFVYIPDNTVLDEPLSIKTIVNNTMKNSLLKYVLVVVGNNVSVDFIEAWSSYGETENLVNAMTHIVGAEGANINYVSIDHLGQQTTNYFSGYASLGKDSKLRYSVAALSEGDHLGKYEIYAEGRGSEGEMEILSLANKTQRKGFDTGTTNIGTHSIGHVLQHGAALDEAFLSFNGVTTITQDAKFSDGRQTSRLLMLSEEARGDVHPILLISQHEVTAGHSASAGQLDKNQLYYLQSRGIDQPTAEKLVTRGFLGVVLERIALRSAQKQIVALIDQRLS